MPKGSPKLDYTAPVLCVDLPAVDERNDNEPFQITPCPDCLPWHIEIVSDDDFPLGVAVREWHAADCPTLASTIAICRDEDKDSD